jgi:hypothetical protein
MSALGQKQTYALQQAMSAPIATAKADFRERARPLYLKKRTFFIASLLVAATVSFS